MPALAFQQITKKFGDNQVIQEFTADIEDKEFLVLLGPSGCGKSTMLRMIAGLTDISSGDLLFDGKRVNDLEPRERNVAFVFQSYALYPHMTVRGNIAFPLIMDRFKPWYHIPIVNSIVRRSLMRDPELRARVEQVAETLELTPYLDRRPRTLSGGQRQRVAVARALVRDPQLYLLDEPLSNLDAKLRNQMRAEISALYQRVGKTFVYVTHDQVEALTMGTKIIILDAGVVQQFGTADDIYHRPANTFVARFIGSPAMNLVPVRVTAGTAGTVDPAPASTVAPPAMVADQITAVPDGDYLLGVRPEQVELSLGPAGTVDQAGLAAHVRVVEHLGGETVIGFKLGPATGITDIGAAASRDMLFAKLPGTVAVRAGDAVRVSFTLAGASWFDATTTRRVEVAQVGAR